MADDHVWAVAESGFKYGLEREHSFLGGGVQHGRIIRIRTIIHAVGNFRRRQGSAVRRGKNYG